MNNPTTEQIKKPYYGYIKNPLISSLELSVRASNVLRNSGLVQTIEDFMALTEETVMALPNAGRRTWREIKDLQESIGRDPWPEPREDLTALRDQAALAALPAIIQVCAGGGPREVGTETFEQKFARKAWAVADAFIAAREGDKV